MFCAWVPSCILNLPWEKCGDGLARGSAPQESCLPSASHTAAHHSGPRRTGALLKSNVFMICPLNVLSRQPGRNLPYFANLPIPQIHRADPSYPAPTATPNRKSVFHSTVSGGVQEINKEVRSKGGARGASRSNQGQEQQSTSIQSASSVPWEPTTVGSPP